MQNEIIIKEGHLELQNGSGMLRTFHRRYIIVKKSGIVNLYEKQPPKDDKYKKKPKESFQLQGGEEIQNAKIYQNRFRIKIVMAEHKKQIKWTFGFESETAQKSWINTFSAVLKHLNALTRLHQVMTGSNADTIEGQLLIGSALADCGHLCKARKIFAKLISKYGDESTQVHEQYETFLSLHCNDIHQAEIHFVQRKKFFCLPKDFRTTILGKQFIKISHRIEFLNTMKNKLLQNDKHKIYEIEYRNIENIWPFYLYYVETKHLISARKLVQKQFVKDSTYEYEYSYQDIEQQCWYIIKQCIDGKRGAIKLQARLQIVGDVESQKKLKSQKYATKFGDSTSAKMEIGASEEFDIFPSKEEYFAEKQKYNLHHKVKLSESVSSIIGSDALNEIIDELNDLGVEYDSDSLNESVEDNFVMLQEEINKEEIKKIRSKSSSRQSVDYDINDINDILDTKIDDNNNNNNNNNNNKTYIKVLEDTSHHIFPWTAMMLIWITRRDEMNHIVGNQLNKEQIQVILEFIYIFTSGCMQSFVSNSEYALLLCALYNMTNDKRDFEDIKYKMLLSGVRVIGDNKVSFCDKNAVSQFMKLNNWLNNINKSGNKFDSMKQYYNKGFKYETQRVHNSLNMYYNNVMYNDKRFNKLIQIRTKNNVRTEINTQCCEKVQGKPSWGPRQNNKYDINGFNFVCKHRECKPPKPIKNPGDFDECYMLFCLSLANELNPFFQKQIKIAIKDLNCKHYDAPVKSSKRCYEIMKHELSKIASPKAARILDFCKCTLSFPNIDDLIKGFKSIDDKFRICKIVNNFNKDYKNINNYKYMNIYIVCKHNTNKFIKLICEVRLSLDEIQQLHDERLKIKECFGQILDSQEMKDITKEVIKGKLKAWSATSNF